MKALFVVDMLKDFINENGELFCGPTARAIIDRVVKEIEKCRAEGGVVVFLCDAHAEDDLEFLRFPKHAVKDTDGANIIAEIPRAGTDIVIYKTRYSGFYNTELDFHLQRLGIDEATVVGVCTSICVMDTVGDLANRDHKTNVIKDAVADFDQEMHEMALKRMEALYGACIS